MTLGRLGSDIALDPRESADGAKVEAYHAVPARGRGKGVLVLGDSSVLTDFARDVCDRLARGGFVALAPDLGDPPAAAIGWGARALLEDDATDGARLGVVAFGEGAARLREAGDPLGRWGCAVVCGGLEGAGWLPVPTLFLCGETDDAAGEVERLAAADSATLRLLPEAGAGFMDPAQADRFHATASAAAWDALLPFLAATL